MSLRGLFALLQTGDLRARMALRRDLHAFLRLQFLAAALELGLRDTREEPRSVDDLATDLGICDKEIFVAFLDLGVSLRMVRRRGGRYWLGKRTARILTRPQNDPLGASVLELVDYHAHAYRHLPGYLRGDEHADYLEGRSELIARSSRLVEPVLSEFSRREIRAAGSPVRILELGCGSGAYLLHAARADPRATGIGVEQRPEVAASTAKSLDRWGIANRFRVVCGDARSLPAEVAGSFDIITLYNNVYYFATDERTRLFAALRERLDQGGKLLIASMMRGTTAASLDLSLVLSVTRGCHALPISAEIVEELRGVGFARVGRHRLLPMEPFFAITAV